MDTLKQPSQKQDDVVIATITARGLLTAVTWTVVCVLGLMWGGCLASFISSNSPPSDSDFKGSISGPNGVEAP